MLGDFNGSMSCSNKTRCIGNHVIVDAWGVPCDLLNDADRIQRALEAAIDAEGASLIDLCVHRFHPEGVTATALLAESHISIHTWPELGYYAADLFFCGSRNPTRALEAIKRTLPASGERVRMLRRGLAPQAVQEQDEDTVY